MEDRYRPDIDGLRAVAVLSVVLYHFQAPGFGGGFAGVDVFFVISGFLIGGHIAGDIAADRFLLVAFYERRIRRILPALFCMLALVLLAGTFILFPPDFLKLIPISLAVVGFVANFRIAETLGAYSGDVARNSPLLHTWSLAVEEQFYLLFPLLMLAIARFSGRRYVAWMAPLALLSLAACVVAARVAPQSNFFLPAFRAWEFLLGALLAVGGLEPPASSKLRGGLALLGLLLIGAADLTLTGETPWPSEFTLLPCVGAGLILYARCEAGSLAGRLLVNPAARWIGLWSYSLYLVHWPLLIFARYYLDAPLSPVLRGVLLAASCGLAALSWRFVEQPFRGRDGLLSTVPLYAVAAGAAILLLGAAFGLRGAYGELHPGWERFFPKPTLAQRVCWDIPPDAAASLPPCHLGARTPLHAVLWGDSHASALVPGVDAAFAAHHDAATVFAMGGCPPVLHLEVRDRAAPGVFKPLQAALDHWSARCPRRNQTALHWIAAHRIPVVILAGYWIAFADPGNAPAAVANHLAPVDATRPQLTDAAAVFETDFGLTIAALQRIGARVYVVEDVPQQNVDVPVSLASDARLGRGARRGISRAAYDAE
ncbi:MAG TPA: acyltransferase family protein, partial [Caulobacteraceae bacterium]